MDPKFIYYNDLKFQDNKVFTIKFSDGGRLVGVLFKKKKDYYLVSMSCFIEITNDLSKLTHYDDIKKMSDLSNTILKNGIDHSYKEKNLEVTFDEVKIELTPEKSNRALSVDVVEFFDYVTKQKRLVFIYSPYKELKEFGLKFENKKTGHIGGFNVMLKEENDKLYLEKELFFNKDKLLENLIKENDNKNVIFIKYKGKIYPFKLEITRAFLKK